MRGRVALLVAALAFASVAGFHGARIIAGWDSEDMATQSVLRDFRDGVYEPAADFVDGGVPYDTSRWFRDRPVDQEFSLYGPHHILLAVPISMLPFGAAAVVWVVLNYALLVGLCAAALRLGMRLLRPSPALALMVGAVVLLTRPGEQNTMLGQPTLFVALGVYAALALPERSWWAAIGLALALTKPQTGVLVVLFLLVVGRRTVAWRGVAIASLLSLPVVAVLVARAGGIGDFIEILQDNIAFSREVRDSFIESTNPLPQPLDASGSFRRVLPSDWSSAVEVVVAVVIIGLAVWLLRRRRDLRAADGLAVTVLLLAVLIAVVHWHYDALLLLWPVLALVGSLRSDREEDRTLRLALLVLLTVPFVNHVGSARGLRVIDGSPLLVDLATSVDAIALMLAFVLSGVLLRRQVREAVNPTPAATAPLSV